MKVIISKFKFFIPITLVLVSICTACDSNSPAAQAPEVTVSNITRTDDGNSEDSISLSWVTDSAADCTVNYGPYRFFGTQVQAVTDGDKLQHSITLEDIHPHTAYHIGIFTAPVSDDYSEGSEYAGEFSTKAYDLAENATGEYESVGALCFYDEEMYYGPFSTGVLIDESWVLTSAHCLEVDASYYGRVPDTTNITFYIGGYDAAPGEDGAVSAEGTLYGIESIVIHNNYDHETRANDIAMIKLLGNVTETTPSDCNTTQLTGIEGNEFTARGFDTGITKLAKNDYQEIYSINQQTYNAQSENYIGESGIIMFDDNNKVIGVLSSVSTDSSQFNSVFTRIDSYSAWISNVIEDYNEGAL